VLEQAAVPSVESIIVRVRWSGHVKQMDNCRITKKMLFCELTEVKQKYWRTTEMFQRLHKKKP
jgi:hypothetical protein